MGSKGRCGDRKGLGKTDRADRKPHFGYLISPDPSLPHYPQSAQIWRPLGAIHEMARWKGYRRDEGGRKGGKGERRTQEEERREARGRMSVEIKLFLITSLHPTIYAGPGRGRRGPGDGEGRQEGGSTVL